jgi:hypothetical protein
MDDLNLWGELCKRGRADGSELSLDTVKSCDYLPGASIWVLKALDGFPHYREVESDIVFAEGRYVVIGDVQTCWSSETAPNSQ